MGTYTLTLDSQHGTTAIHEGLTFQEALDAIDSALFESRFLRPEVTNSAGALTAEEREAIDATANTARGARR